MTKTKPNSGVPTIEERMEKLFEPRVQAYYINGFPIDREAWIVESLKKIITELLRDVVGEDDSYHASGGTDMNPRTVVFTKQAEMSRNQLRREQRAKAKSWGVNLK